MKKFLIGIFFLSLLSLVLFSFRRSVEFKKNHPPAINKETKYYLENETPDSVLKWLKEGNELFRQGEFNQHGVDTSLRIKISAEQHPRAVILTCADSRVSPELIFDKGLGDLFVIRVAGNIVDDAVLGSIEYAVEHLHTSLIVVMGHQYCGAISAAVSDWRDPEKANINNHIRSLTDKIEQAVVSINLNEKDLDQKILLSNVIFSVNSIRESRPDLYEESKKSHIRVVGSVYDLKTGKVEWLK